MGLLVREGAGFDPALHLLELQQLGSLASRDFFDW
jgi:hypothetical protein